MLPASGWAFVHTSMFWAPNLNMPRPAGLNTGGYSTTGFGFTLEYMVTRRTGLEFGAIYEPQVLNGTISDNLTIPVMYRFWFSQVYTFSIGGYYGSQFTNLPNFLSGEGYGVRATIGTNRKITRRVSLILEAGYQYGVSNLSLIAGASFYRDQAFAVVGIRFGGIQSVTKVAANGMRYSLDRPPEFQEHIEIPQELLP